MLAKRIIPCLDCKDGRVVKGVQFVDLRDAGDPAELAEVYNREGADELVMLDISASREGRATLMDTVNRVARKLGDATFREPRHKPAAETAKFLGPNRVDHAPYCHRC